DLYNAIVALSQLSYGPNSLRRERNDCPLGCQDGPNFPLVRFPSVGVFATIRTWGLDRIVATLKSAGGNAMQANNAGALQGLILAGGRSSRMGVDKGLIDYHGQAQVTWLAELLGEYCASVRVSVGSRQDQSGDYATMTTIVDHQPGLGPAGGLISAWKTAPEAAWLLVAVDMPLLDRATLTTLTAGRSATDLATAFRHPDGMLEPLCTIWEPSARVLLERRLERGDASLRRLLESGPVRVLMPPSSGSLSSVDRPEDRNRIRRRLEKQRRLGIILPQDM
ncbi:MAG: NTP transferase domain-containing protein, partial [Rhodospirillaceae bacterium]|nr:NTP transferase domain-containing protein [Rhodospirillaceae bacterium]